MKYWPESKPSKKRKRFKMIQDIYPSRIDISFKNKLPAGTDRVLFFKDNTLLIRYEDEKILFPEAGEFPEGTEFQYLFLVDDISFFICFESKTIPQNYEFKPMSEVRRLKLSSNKRLFEAFTGFHLYQWYRSSRFCGCCGNPTEFDTVERAMVCPSCKNKIYPRINPAVIIGVINNDKILLTKYKTGFAHNALVAGFVEIGESLVDTVRREVMAEVGLNVRNIRYYKSQPWGVVSDLLAGFFCYVDGDDKIKMDENELKYAEWVKREDIELQPYDISLTNEMMKIFKNQSLNL